MNNKTFYRGNVDELSALRAVMKKPVLSRAEQAEVLRNEIEALVADANGRGFSVGVRQSGVVVTDVRGAR